QPRARADAGRKGRHRHLPGRRKPDAPGRPARGHARFAHRPGRSDPIMSGSDLTHLDARGQAHIVDIADKPATRRRARAQARLTGKAGTIAALLGGSLRKGDALAVARIAGIMAAKKTADLIPLCHPIPLTSVSVEIAGENDTALRIEAIAETTGQTGVEMEALVAASTAAL